jgi:cytochrome c peroxidase
MANRNMAELNVKLRHASYAGRFQELFGIAIFDHPTDAITRATEAVEAFQTEDPSFQPYTSKFDSVMSGHASFTDQERRGYRLFNDPRNGNCAKCHVDAPGPGGRPAQFTDFGFVALGVPRNPELEANNDPRYFDLGLCGPIRGDLAKEAALCGMFKTPTLRNVAGRQAYFHNGGFHSLENVLKFYSERDSAPAKWYPAASGKVVVYDDLPASYRTNVDHVDEPFTRKPGDKPAFRGRDIDDLIAFLKTLDDGYASEPGGDAVR